MGYSHTNNPWAEDKILKALAGEKVVITAPDEKLKNRFLYKLRNQRRFMETKRPELFYGHFLDISTPPQSLIIVIESFEV